MAQKPSTYHGRLETDGEGNLLASEGEFAGHPVAFHEGSYIFVIAGEPSHNQRHHQQFLVVTATVDEDMTDDPDLVNVGDGENMHHFGVLEDDPNYEEGATNADGVVTNIRARLDPDAIAATATSHTEAYRDA